MSLDRSLPKRFVTVMSTMESWRRGVAWRPARDGRGGWVSVQGRWLRVPAALRRGSVALRATPADVGRAISLASRPTRMGSSSTWRDSGDGASTPAAAGPDRGGRRAGMVIRCKNEYDKGARETAFGGGAALARNGADLVRTPWGRLWGRGGCGLGRWGGFGLGGRGVGSVMEAGDLLSSCSLKECWWQLKFPLLVWRGRGSGLVVRGKNEYDRREWETEFGAGAGLNRDLVGGRIRRVRRRKRSWSGGRDGLGDGADWVVGGGFGKDGFDCGGDVGAGSGS